MLHFSGMILNCTDSVAHHTPCLISITVGTCGPHVQERMARTVFAAWVQAAESLCLRREAIEREISQRANARHVSMAFKGWCRLHRVCRQDAQRAGVCKRCASCNSGRVSVL